MGEFWGHGRWKCLERRFVVGNADVRIGFIRFIRVNAFLVRRFRVIHVRVGAFQRFIIAAFPSLLRMGRERYYGVDCIVSGWAVGSYLVVNILHVRIVEFLRGLRRRVPRNI